MNTYHRFSLVSLILVNLLFGQASIDAAAKQVGVAQGVPVPAKVNGAPSAPAKTSRTGSSLNDIWAAHQAKFEAATKASQTVNAVKPNTNDAAASSSSATSAAPTKTQIVTPVSPERTAAEPAVEPPVSPSSPATSDEEGYVDGPMVAEEEQRDEEVERKNREQQAALDFWAREQRLDEVQRTNAVKNGGVAKHNGAAHSPAAKAIVKGKGAMPLPKGASPVAVEFKAPASAAEPARASQESGQPTTEALLRLLLQNQQITMETLNAMNTRIARVEAHQTTPAKDGLAADVAQLVNEGDPAAVQQNATIGLMDIVQHFNDERQAGGALGAEAVSDVLQFLNFADRAIDALDGFWGQANGPEEQMFNSFEPAEFNTTGNAPVKRGHVPVKGSNVKRS